MASLPTSITFDLRCPDCDEAVPVEADLTSVVDKPNRVASLSVHVGDVTAARFAAHVMHTPEAHPSFATPVSDGA